MPLTCTDPDGDPLALAIADGPSKGSLGAIAGGTVTYTPGAGESGADSFTYTAEDGDGASAPVDGLDHDHPRAGLRRGDDQHRPRHGGRA